MAEKSVRIISRDLKFPEARFLNEEEQTKYEELCKSFGEKARVSLNVGEKGSNLFKVLLLNQSGIRTTTLHELDLIAETSPDFLKGFYEDAPAVVLRSAGDSYSQNDYLAKSLASLIGKSDFPHAVVIEGLKVKEDSNSGYGLSFEKGEKFKFIKAPAFDHANNVRKFARINPDYTIDFDKSASRELYTRETGLSGLSLGGALVLYSSFVDLAYSSAAGRVVCVADEVAPKNFPAEAKAEKEA